MKIVLVYPPFLNSIRTTLPEFVNENEGYFPPLGIMYIVSYLKKHRKDCEILVIDSVLERINHLQIAQRVVNFGADIVGISCWTFSLIDALQVAKEVKKISPQTLVCLGGPHVNIYPKETVSKDYIDFVITNDGEKAFTELINQLKTGQDFNCVPNLYYKKSGKIEESPLKYIEKNLDNLPFPDRNWTDFSKYYSIMDKERPITTMITSRGCPFNCSFCFQQRSGWRFRTPSNIVDEMEYCLKLGIRNFFIFDETFTVSKKRVIELCNEIKKRKLQVVWSCRSRVDTVDEEVLDNLREAGCKRISFGVESANPQVLKRLNKQITVPQAIEVFKLAKKKKIVTLADFMIGCPEENFKRTKETIQLAKILSPDYVQFSALTLLPATKLYEEALTTGVVKNDVWLNYAINPTINFKPPLWNIYREREVQKLLLISYRMFYLRAPYILRQLLSIRSFAQLKIYSKAAVGLVKTVFRPFVSEGGTGVARNPLLRVSGRTH